MLRRIRIVILVAAGLLGASQPVGSAVQDVSDATAPNLPAVTRERLPNGIRVIHLPTTEESVDGYTEVAFGYVPADAGAGVNGSRARKLFTSYLSLSVPARSVALAAHLAGGEFEFLELPDRIGMRVRLPRESLENVARQISRYFSHAIISFEVLEHARLLVEEAAGRVVPRAPIDEIHDEVESVLFGRLQLGFEEQPEAAGLGDVQSYFDRYIGTDRGYVITSDPLPPAALAALGAVTFRASTYESAGAVAEATETELRFPSRPTGGVILATAIPSPRYESWFSALVIDRLLRRSAEPEVRFDYRIEVGASIHRIELPVSLPDYSEDLRDEWIARIQNVLFESLPTAELDELKAGVFDQLRQREMLEWFVAHQLWDSLRVGWDMLGELTPDGLRSRALAFAGARRVVALWSPAFEQPSILVEELGAVAESTEPGPEQQVRVVPGNVAVPAVSAFQFSNLPPVRLLRLESAVTLAEGEEHMIFVSGRFDEPLEEGQVVKSGANGILWVFGAEPSDNVLAQLEAVRPDRLLIFYPPSGLTDARRRFESFTGGATDDSPSLGVGEVATVDLPGLIVLKTWLEAKLIEAGWWGQVELGIDGIEGSRLLIAGEPERESVVRSWIAELAEDGITESDFERVRTASMGYFQRIRRELQIILWQRAPEGMIPPPETFTLARLRDVAGTYFEYSD